MQRMITEDKVSINIKQWYGIGEGIGKEYTRIPPYIPKTSRGGGGGSQGPGRRVETVPEATGDALSSRPNLTCAMYGSIGHRFSPRKSFNILNQAPQETSR
mmetsp:Transcript_31545/g.64199  ORF Transcript_31545/g.64199 Transcript_31545/m.64199 type:complete len:101 (-) Transcript_31545:8-310(-)